MTNAKNTIAQAINNAITSFKNGWDNANNLPNQNNGGFSLSIFLLILTRLHHLGLQLVSYDHRLVLFASHKY